MTSIFDNTTERENVCCKINEIADYLCGKDLAKNNQSLMYGNMGIAIFLMYYWKWTKNDKYYDKATELVMDVFNELNKQIQIYKFESQKVDLTFKSGLGGLGWGINHLITNGFIESELEETMCQIDASIYRQMIDGIYSSKENENLLAMSIALYAVSRNDRFSKEYLRRFVTEWHKCLSNQPQKTIYPNIAKEKNYIPLFILHKIADKYQDIDYTNKLIEQYVPEQAIHSFDETEELIVDAGLEHGLAAIAYRKYRRFCKTSDIMLKNDAKDCLKKMFQRTNYIDSSTNVKLWQTASRGIYGLHLGLLNGISGLALALLSTVCDIEPEWEDCLIV